MNKRYTGLFFSGLMAFSLSSPIIFATPGTAKATPVAAPEVSSSGQRTSLFGVILDIGLASFNKLSEQWGYESKQTVACPLHTTLEVAGAVALAYGVYKLASAAWNGQSRLFRFRGQAEHQG